MTKRNIFFISDTHFFHSNILKFVDDDGSPVRSFSSVDEMNETMAENWNAVVRPQDKIYHLGDVTFHYGKAFRELWYRLNGHKRLLLGNHDRLKGTGLIDCFEKIELWRMFPEHDFVATHVPIAMSANASGAEKYRFNVHGHMHTRSLPDHRYINISVEQVGYRPLHLDEILEIIKVRSREARAA